MSVNQNYRFLIIGCGSIGKRHIRNLKSLNVEDIFVYDMKEERRLATADEFGVRPVADLDEGWQLTPNVVVVAVPTILHISLALKAAEHGCHLFIEKPLSNCLNSESDKLFDIVRHKSLVTLVGCNMRFHPVLSRIKMLLMEGAVGQVVGARVEFGQYLPDWHPWEDYRQGYSANKRLGGGVILDAIHEIDYIRWMLGEVNIVVCLADKLSKLNIDTEDTAAILLHFTSGVIGEIHLDYVQRAPSRTCHIFGNEGVIRGDCLNGTVSLYQAASGSWQTFNNPAGWEPNHIYVDEMKHFLRCLDGEEQPIQDIFESEKVLQIALAAKKSAEKQGFVKVRGEL